MKRKTSNTGLQIKAGAKTTTLVIQIHITRWQRMRVKIGRMLISLGCRIGNISCHLSPR
jgi:hypothetical protein